MKKIILYLIFSISTISLISQTDSKQDVNITTQIINSVPYRLFPTENIWTFIKLDTRNGLMWQVQYSLKSEGRFETYLNLIPLISKDKEVNDRFTLYPTHNIFTFILLDQIEGKIWQIQWSTDPEKRGIVPIE
jgi:hypothetical protein